MIEVPEIVVQIWKAIYALCSGLMVYAIFEKNYKLTKVVFFIYMISALLYLGIFK